MRQAEWTGSASLLWFEGTGEEMSALPPAPLTATEKGVTKPGRPYT